MGLMLASCQNCQNGGLAGFSTDIRSLPVVIIARMAALP